MFYRSECVFFQSLSDFDSGETDTANADGLTDSERISSELSQISDKRYLQDVRASRVSSVTDDSMILMDQRSFNDDQEEEIGDTRTVVISNPSLEELEYVSIQSMKRNDIDTQKYYSSSLVN